MILSNHYGCINYEKMSLFTIGIFLRNLSSCMISTTSSVKEFSENIPCYIDEGVFISNISFEENASYIPLILWRFNNINKKAKGITICFTNGVSYFPSYKQVDLKNVIIRYKNNKEITPISKKIETDSTYDVFDNVDYSFCEALRDNDIKGSFGAYNTLDGKMISFTRYCAPEGYIGEYRITIELDEFVKLKKADELELQIVITDNGVTTEITKVLKFDMKYKTSTESMFGAWVKMY